MAVLFTSSATSVVQEKMKEVIQLMKSDNYGYSSEMAGQPPNEFSSQGSLGLGRHGDLTLSLNQSLVTLLLDTKLSHPPTAGELFLLLQKAAILTENHRLEKQKLVEHANKLHQQSRPVTARHHLDSLRSYSTADDGQVQGEMTLTDQFLAILHDEIGKMVRFDHHGVQDASVELAKFEASHPKLIGKFRLRISYKVEVLSK